MQCACGRRHWGTHGAAGLLLHRSAGGRTQVVLQHRALWSDHGGTWALPGGALAPGETPEQGAVREAAEEAGIDPAALEIHDAVVLDHGPWRYTTVVARATGPHDVRPTDAESLEVAWVDVDAVADRPLLPAFAGAWPGLRALLG
ncbi:NUDIX hydrolase [Actinotalea sp. JY-7885]|uniref:NUDIX hydrolase n=1 Tax=unclassified Actinotalea TaxID=2638618 RepID=UPI00281516E4|nr:NUDIX hydrolase [Actinotalea sp. JY-7885]